MISTKLWGLLLSTTSASTEVDEIVSDPELHALAKAIAPDVVREAAGCEAQDVRRALSVLVMTFGQEAKAKAPEFWTPYFKALTPLPKRAIREAVDDYIEAPDSKFMPKPGPLKALAMKRAEPILRAANRLRRAAATKAPEPYTPPTPEERDRVRLMLADFNERMAAKFAEREARRPKPKWPQGYVDEGGLTQAMREHLASLQM